MRHFVPILKKIEEEAVVEQEMKVEFSGLENECFENSRDSEAESEHQTEMDAPDSDSTWQLE